MCRIFEEYGDERAKIAKEEGKAEAQNAFAEDLIRDGSLSLERISAISRLPLERVKEIAEKLAASAMA